MRPLSITERNLAVPTVRVRDLLSADVPDIHGSSDVELRDYVREIVTSGFPQPRQMSDRARGVWLDDYIERVITHDFTEQGHRIRRPELLRGWLRGYAAATASATTFAKIGASLDPGEPTGPTKKTSIAYRDILSSLYLLDQVDAGYRVKSSCHELPSRRSTFSQIRHSPRAYSISMRSNCCRPPNR